MSHWGLSVVRCIRNASRIRRLMRFRTTLPPIAFGTVSPNRATPPVWSPCRARQKAANKGPETRLPWSYTLRKSAVRRALGNEEDKEGDTGEHRGAPPPARSAGFGVTDGLLVAYGQLVTAAGPASRQYSPAVLSLHALTKSVHFGALAIIRLKSTFRHICLSSARNAHSAGASFDGVVCRRIQYNKRIARGRCSFEIGVKTPRAARNPRFRQIARSRPAPIPPAAFRKAPQRPPRLHWAPPGSSTASAGT